MSKYDDEYDWDNKDYFVEIRQSSLKQMQEIAFWSGVGVGILTIAFGYGLIWLFIH